MFLKCKSDPESLVSNLLELPRDDPPSLLCPSSLPVLLGQPPIVTEPLSTEGKDSPQVTGEAERLKWQERQPQKIWGGTFQGEGTPSARTQGELGRSQVHLRVGKTAIEARAQERRGADHTGPRAMQAGRGWPGPGGGGKRSSLALRGPSHPAVLSAALWERTQTWEN